MHNIHDAYEDVCPYILSTSAAAVHLRTNSSHALSHNPILCGSSLCKVYPDALLLLGKNRGEAVRAYAQSYCTLQMSVR